MNKDKIKDALRQALKKDNSSENQKRPKRTPIIVLIVMCLLIFGLQYSTTKFSSSTQQNSANIITPPNIEIPSEQGTSPQGKIISPVEGTVTGNEVSVICETKNIAPGTYLWLAVDKPEIGLCWPKGFSNIEPNTKLKINILEEGPKEEYRLSLYALNENYNTQWQDWIDHKIFGGLHIPPDSKRLTSVTLVLGP